MPLLKFIPLHLTSCLVLGILVGYYWKPDTHIISLVLMLSLAALAVLYFQLKNAVKRSFFFAGGTFLVFLFIGIAAITFHNDLNRKNHYTTVLSEHPVTAILTVSAVMKPSNYYTKYEANVQRINDQEVQGSILINIRRDSLNNRLKVGDRLRVHTRFLEIDTPKNPYQFNYKAYLEKHHIHRQIRISYAAFELLVSHKTSLKGLAQRFRLYVNDKLVENGFRDDELAVINALLLGQREDISTELIENYSKAGAIHILAVSGLHVGLIMVLIGIFLRPLKRFKKNGKFLHTAILVLLLWVFAFIAGMSASVVRAVTMFTALSIGLAIGRKNSLYKNLIISLFFLLLLNPYYLFEVGFQLSYVAVFSIVWIQPMIYQTWRPTWKLSDFIWQLFTVSFAAQLGVLPLSLYYFHQFPGLFFLTNLAIIPVLGMILGLGIFVIVLSMLNVIPILLAHFYQEIIHTMNALVSWIAKQESFLFQEIYFSLLLVLSSYALIVCCFRWMRKKTQYNFKTLLLSLIILQGVFIYEKYRSATTNELVIFNTSKASAIAIKKNRRIRIYKSDNFNESSTVLRAYRTGSNAEKVEIVNTLRNVFVLNKMKIVVVDSLGVYSANKIKSDGILLRQSPKVNLERLIGQMNPKFIVADASNYKSYVKYWRQTCSDRTILFHYTATDGAFSENF